jgi:hypothetical protein
MLQKDAVAAGQAYRFFAAFTVNIGYDDLCAFLRQCNTVCPTKAGAPACHECYFSFYAPHESSSLLFGFCYVFWCRTLAASFTENKAQKRSNYSR